MRGDDKEDDEHEGRHVFFRGGHDFWMILVNAKSIVFDRGANLTILSVRHRGGGLLELPMQVFVIFILDDYYITAALDLSH